MKKLFLTAALVAFTYGFSQSYYYDDYKKSIITVNWDRAGYELGLTPTQIAALNLLDNRYPDYDSWNRHYGNNPDSWRTDRYGEIERILGREKYESYKNKYYKGQNPVAVYNRNKNNNIPLINKGKNDTRIISDADRYNRAKSSNKAARAEKGKSYKAKSETGKTYKGTGKAVEQRKYPVRGNSAAVKVNGNVKVNNMGARANTSAGVQAKGNGNGRGK